jgi:regulator of protease activity HflC (stomatin/prohibitin superfamily)
MPPLEEPTVAEMIRSLGSKVDGLGAVVIRMETAVSNYVTQEQRAHDKAINAEQDRVRDARIAELEEKDKRRARLVMSGLLLPVIVGVLVWLLTKGQV